MLPADIADFSGRATEVDEIVGLLLRRPESAPSPHIVTLSGAGGAGKTTLAVHVAHRVIERFPDGQLCASLHGAEARPYSAVRVLGRFLRALGVPGTAIPDGLDERAEIYRGQLAGRRVLVILDDAATDDQVLPLLPAEPGSAVVVTGRVRLTAVPGAHRVEVGMMGLAHAIAFLGRVIGPDRVQAEPAAIRTLVDLCGGLPLP